MPHTMPAFESNSKWKKCWTMPTINIESFITPMIYEMAVKKKFSKFVITVLFQFRFDWIMWAKSQQTKGKMKRLKVDSTLTWLIMLLIWWVHPQPWNDISTECSDKNQTMSPYLWSFFISHNGNRIRGLGALLLISIERGNSSCHFSLSIALFFISFSHFIHPKGINKNFLKMMGANFKKMQNMQR